METTLNRYTCTCYMVIMILSIGTYVHVLSSEIDKYEKQARALVEDLETKIRDIKIIIIPPTL